MSFELSCLFQKQSYLPGPTFVFICARTHTDMTRDPNRYKSVVSTVLSTENACLVDECDRTLVLPIPGVVGLTKQIVKPGREADSAADPRSKTDRVVSPYS